jgi:SAM-dependent methyltransferase
VSHLTKAEVAKAVEEIRSRYAAYGRDPRLRSEWSAFAQHEADYRGQQIRALANLMRRIGRLDLSGMKVLDVGCGSGRLLRSMVDMGTSTANCFGVEIQRHLIESARERSHPAIQFQTIDGSSLPFEVESFDLITQFTVFSSIHLSQLRAELATEMVRVLKPQGVIFWWDAPQCVHSSGEKLDLDLLFPGLPRSEFRYGRMPLPSECLTKKWGIRSFLGPIVDRFAMRPSHVAALVMNRCGIKDA